MAKKMMAKKEFPPPRIADRMSHELTMKDVDEYGIDLGNQHVDWFESSSDPNFPVGFHPDSQLLFMPYEFGEPLHESAPPRNWPTAGEHAKVSAKRSLKKIKGTLRGGMNSGRGDNPHTYSQGY
jgi:hypothetical protein